MSSKTTIFLTNDHNEHAYYDCSEQYESEKSEHGVDAITIEFDKENIRIDYNDDASLVITITNVNSELYEVFNKLEQIVPDKNR